MKYKSKISLLMVVMMVLGILSGCSNPQTQVTDVTQGTTDKTETANAAKVLSAEEDALLKEDLQKDIDTILNAETEIVHSDNYIPGETYTGTAYYVSADGNDSNDGLTPETAWQSAEKVGKESMEGGILQFGDAVFFRRGDIFRSFDFDAGATPFTCRIDGITYSAYGEGEKPVITSSPENGTGAEKWKLVYEDESGTKIWQFYNPLTDIAMVVCDDEVVADRIYEWCAQENVEDGSGYVSCTLDYWWMHEDGGVELLDELLPLEKTLTEDMTFVSRPARWPIQEDMNTAGVGPLYLRCDAGNPGELFDSIEFSAFEVFGLISLEANDIVFDNLSLKYTGISYIKNWYHWKSYQNTIIQNCEFAYGGGSVSNYHTADNGTRIVATMGDGVYCVVRNATIRNNYFHDSAATAIGYEASNFDVQEPTQDFGYLHLLNNVVVNTMGIRLDSSVDQELQCLDSVIIRENQVWNTGRMDNGRYYYSESALCIWGSHFSECIVENNVFYGTENGHPAGNALLSPDVYTDEMGYTLPVFQNNTYIQHNSEKLAMFWGHGEEIWYIDKEDDVEKFKDMLGDTTSEFYIIPTE